MDVTTGSLEEFTEEARRFAARLLPHSAGATIVALSGELGVGKTTFAQAMARALGVEETVTSPTFVIEKMYALKGQKFSRLIHIDAYRLDGAAELEVLGWKDILADPANLIVLEWPERVESVLPANAIRIALRGTGQRRVITQSTPVPSTS